MSEPLTQTFQIVVEQQVTDLEMCLMCLRLIAKQYPRHFDIALEALKAEYSLPLMQEAMREEQS